MIGWGKATCEDLVAPAAGIALLERAVRAAPDNPEPLVRIGHIHVDNYRFADAAAAFEAALRLAPERRDLCLKLATQFVALQRPAEALALLDTPDSAERYYLRGCAFAALEQDAEAETAFRAALDADPHHRRACMKLCKILRETDRMGALLTLCEWLVAQGVGHAQLLLDWGRALAIAGEDDKARRLLFDPARVTRTILPVTDGFNDALAGEILANPYPVGEFPLGDEANRGSMRVHHLMGGRQPELVRALLTRIRDAIDARIAAMEVPSGNGFDPWPASLPRSARLNPWGLIQKRDAYEEWHTHRGGWLSGVYYVRVPRGVAEADDGRGALEFGPPPYLARKRPGFLEARRYVPQEGVLVLAPSHYHHRTIPSGLDEHRISLAFDVVPDAP